MGLQMMAPAGGVIFGVGLCIICCFALDRKFEEAVVTSVLASVLSVFGLFGSHNDIIDRASGGARARAVVHVHPALTPLAFNA
jgi:hypothetical protein